MVTLQCMITDLEIGYFALFNNEEVREFRLRLVCVTDSLTAAERDFSIHASLYAKESSKSHSKIFASALTIRRVNQLTQLGARKIRTTPILTQAR